MPSSLSPPSVVVAARRILFVLLLCTSRVAAQSAPLSPDRPWRFPQQQQIESDAKGLGNYRFSIDSAKTYSLAELIDWAESHIPRPVWHGNVPEPRPRFWGSRGASCIPL
jgi:hypothetical protein